MSPSQVVSAFIDRVGSAGAIEDRTASANKIILACESLSPDIRAGIRFQESVQPRKTDCAEGLGTMAYYTGDSETGPRPPKSFTGKVVSTTMHGKDRAVVTVDMHYVSDPADVRGKVKVLAVRRDGRWWVATPLAVNVRFLSEQPSYAQLAHQYDELRAANRTAVRQHHEGDKVSSSADQDLHPCPTDGLSRAADPSGDVKLADGGTVVTPAPAHSDLRSASHAVEGDQACFQLQYADDAPARAAFELDIRPTGERVAISVESDGKVVGQMGDDPPEAVPAQVSRDGKSMTVRVPAKTIGAKGSYRWAVESFTPQHGSQRSYLDSIPSDLTVYRERDQYIPHPPR
jgi:hypothetical protein